MQKKLAILPNATTGKEKIFMNLIDHCEPNQLKGDSTPPYLFQEGIAERIKKYNPEMRFYVCLRDPIERAYSSYFYHRSTGTRAVLFDFDEAIEEMKEAYVKPSKYYTCLKEYLDRFPREDIFIMIYDDIEEDPIGFIQQIYEFLEVDDDFEPEAATERMNVVKKGTLQRKRYLKFIWSLENFVRRHKSNFLIKPFYNLFRYRAFKVWGKVRQLGVKKNKDLPRQERPPMKPETKKRLRKTFRPEIEKIEDLVNKDLSSWK
ncbi:hypothetical protein AKJ56_01690 [candidate division MSBL1 archaeon SCGC-AAA382N08]|uniref:Sulfotransferase domain-containing protein n=1 Tax=candidate division MSBL1 archaeon SCGC-AAA382N08 TaxID=1698285 RepID=A0A133VP05_9EURY|nr:hypothetical protein AKJ56_01690 [candidate division MSBL1 archaeon SCGC-AAA382N08]